MTSSQLLEALCEQVHKLASQHDAGIAKAIQGLWDQAKALNKPAAPAAPTTPEAPKA